MYLLFNFFYMSGLPPPYGKFYVRRQNHIIQACSGSRYLSALTIRLYPQPDCCNLSWSLIVCTVDLYNRVCQVHHGNGAFHSDLHAHNISDADGCSIYINSACIFQQDRFVLLLFTINCCKTHWLIPPLLNKRKCNG